MQDGEPCANTLPDEDARLHLQAVQALEKLYSLQPDHLEGLIVGAPPSIHACASSVGQLCKGRYRPPFSCLAKSTWRVCFGQPRSIDALPCSAQLAPLHVKRVAHLQPLLTLQA